MQRHRERQKIKDPRRDRPAAIDRGRAPRPPHAESKKDPADGRLPENARNDSGFYNVWLQDEKKGKAFAGRGWQLPDGFCQAVAKLEAKAVPRKRGPRPDTEREQRYQECVAKGWSDRRIAREEANRSAQEKEKREATGREVNAA